MARIKSKSSSSPVTKVFILGLILLGVLVVVALWPSEVHADLQKVLPPGHQDNPPVAATVAPHYALALDGSSSMRGFVGGEELAPFLTATLEKALFPGAAIDYWRVGPQGLEKNELLKQEGNKRWCLERVASQAAWFTGYDHLGGLDQDSDGTKDAKAAAKAFWEHEVQIIITDGIPSAQEGGQTISKSGQFGQLLSRMMGTPRGLTPDRHAALVRAWLPFKGDYYIEKPRPGSKVAVNTVFPVPQGHRRALYMFLLARNADILKQMVATIEAAAKGDDGINQQWELVTLTLLEDRTRAAAAKTLTLAKVVKDGAGYRVMEPCTRGPAKGCPAFEIKQEASNHLLALDLAGLGEVLRPSMAPANVVVQRAGPKGDWVDGGNLAVVSFQEGENPRMRRLILQFDAMKDASLKGTEIYRLGIPYSLNFLDYADWVATESVSYDAPFNDLKSAPLPRSHQIPLKTLGLAEMVSGIVEPHLPFKPAFWVYIVINK